MPDLSGPLTSAGDGKGAPLRQGPPSTLGAVRSRPLRRLVVASLGVALGALAAVNAADAGPNDGEIAALHDEIAAEEAEIAVLAQQVGTAEQQVSDLLALIAEGDQAIMNLEADIAEAGARVAAEDHELQVLPVRIELLADLVIDHYLELAEPTTVRHVMAIDSYVNNDEIGRAHV